jgi:cobalt-zinc-cadmium efflux system protein
MMPKNTHTHTHEDKAAGDHKHDSHKHNHNHDSSEAHSHSHEGHDHSGHNHSHDAPAQFNFAFAIAILFNFSFTLIETFYAIWANSMGLLADAGHNFGDVLGLLFAWGANLLLTRGSSQRYSYGFKRTTILAALANALILVATSAIIILESVRKLIHMELVNEITVITVALIGIAINGGTALLFMKGHDDLNVKAAFLHLAYDALISFGVVVSGVVIYFTGWHRLDPLMGLVIVSIILYGTWDLLKNSTRLILDAVPARVDHAKVALYLGAIPGVTEVHDLHIWGLSTKEVALTAHLIIPEGAILTDSDYLKINSELKQKFHINHVTLQVERGTHENACGQSSTC